MNKCKAIQYSDMMHCADCRLAWDVNDPEPPPCDPKKEDPPENRRLRDVKSWRKRMRALRPSRPKAY